MWQQYLVSCDYILLAHIRLALHKNKYESNDDIKGNSGKKLQKYSHVNRKDDEICWEKRWQRRCREGDRETMLFMTVHGDGEH